jgi:large subunit ribosomal protein L9
MKVILKKTVDNLGESGEIVDVKPGYARNYLIPQDLAYEASAANMRKIEEEQQQSEERAKKDFLEAKRRAAQMEGTVLTFHARAGQDGKLFGSVTSGDIAERIVQKGLDFELDRRKIVLEEPVKLLGVSKVPVRLHPEVTVEIEVRVEREEE